MTSPRTVGILYPGEMGTFVAACAGQAGCRVAWASVGRSEATQRRADAQGFRDLESVAGLAGACDVMLSVCPPHAAEDVAADVQAAGFRGIFVEANAISPERVVAMARRLEDAGIRFVDGGIVGQPAWRPGATWLHLSGSASPEVAACFEGGDLPTVDLGPEVGRASALKMCFAANTKGTTALQAAILATAEHFGVRAALDEQWEAWQPGLPDRVATRLRGVARKGWRFAGEMDEIAATLRAAGMPEGFHVAAGDIYRRLASYKDAAEPPALASVLETLARPFLYHIAASADATKAEAAGTYVPPAFAREGFVHCSYAHQVLAVAERFFRGRDDLVLIEIDPARVGHRVVEENLEGGDERYPHLYGPLPWSAVTWTRPLTADGTGRFRFPAPR